MIKKIILLLSLVMSSVSVYAGAETGHETGNGGDSHLARYLVAKQIAEVVTRNTTKGKLKEIIWDKELLNVVSDKILLWPRVIGSLEFISVDDMLYENGKEKAAINIVNSNQIKISKAYFEKYNMSLEEVIINIIHESGHKMGISDHNKLDQIGSILVYNIYKYSLLRNSWEKYLVLDNSIQNKFDKRLAKVALEYVANGEGIKLAEVLFYFGKNINNSNLAQLVRFMTIAKLDTDIKDAQFSRHDFWQYRNSVNDRFIKELILFSQRISPKECNELVKYGMAKLKVSGLFYNEDINNFDLIADNITKVLLNKELTMEEKSNQFKRIIKDNFFALI